MLFPPLPRASSPCLPRLRRLCASQGLLAKGDAKGVADFLQKCGAGLSKKRIGEYVGSSDEFNQQVFSHFLEYYDFKGRTLDEVGPRPCTRLPARPSFIGSPSLMPVLVLVLALLGMLGMLVLCRGPLSL